MNIKKFNRKTALTVAMCSAIIQLGYVTPAHARAYGKGSPFQLNDLPPQTQLRQRLEALPAFERQKALDHLHTFSFPEQDLNTLQIDEDGNVYYSDTQLPSPINSAPAGTASVIALPPIDVFKLHSRPGASKKVFLDFDGHIVSGTAWNNSSGITSYVAVPFDIESPANPSNFSVDERNRIAETWHRVAEDFAPFDVDVTTEEPITFSATVGRLLFTKDTDANGTAMPSQGAGGVAYVNVFGASNYATTYSPAFVYYNGLGSGHPPYMAEAASHEFGHNLGLSHDGVLDGLQNTKCSGTTGYYCGLGNGFVSWGPIMGVGYYTNVTDWSKGEYPSANNTQDDLSIIASKLQYRTDDISNTTLNATPLRIETDGSVATTTPQNDPGNVDSANKGVIETGADVDTFWFDAGAGPINITVTPAWAAFTRTSTRGANLDIDAKLYNQAGSLVASSDPLDNTNATLAATLPAGRYYLTIAGVGNSVTPYSDYGSLGEYFISGSVTPTTVDNTAPTPNPMTWAITPVAQSSSQIAMTATTATDDSGAVQYQFQCVAPIGASGCVNSAWQDSPTYVATGLAATTSYSFTVTARDAQGNTTQASAPAGAITLSNQTPIAGADSGTTNEDTALSLSVLSNDSDPEGAALTIASTTTPLHGTAAIVGSTITYTPATNYNGADSFSYTISDGNGGFATATVSLTVNAVNDAPVASPDTATLRNKTTITINPLTNDNDPDVDPLTLSAVTASGTTRGTFVKNGNSINYTATRTGTARLNYTVIDGKGGTATSSISINITR